MSRVDTTLSNGHARRSVHLVSMSPIGPCEVSVA